MQRSEWSEIVERSKIHDNSEVIWESEYRDGYICTKLVSILL